MILAKAFASLLLDTFVRSMLVYLGKKLTKSKYIYFAQFSTFQILCWYCKLLRKSICKL